jgi:hypothetical protein
MPAVSRHHSRLKLSHKYSVDTQGILSDVDIPLQFVFLDNEKKFNWFIQNTSG